MIDWGRVHQYGGDRWRELDVQGKSQAMVNAGLDCREFQKESFVKIASELYHTEGIPIELFWKTGVPEYGNPQDVKDHLRWIGEDILVDRGQNLYKDVVVSMGIPAASWNAGGGGYPVTPGDLNRCGPPPNLEGEPVPPEPPPTGDIVLRFQEYPTTARRSDPKGFLVYWDMDSPHPIAWFEIGLVGSAEVFRLQVLEPFPPDGRYFRGLAWKVTENGDWTLRLTVRDIHGTQASIDGDSLVHVIP